MAEGFPANRREAILAFHFADRVKAELLLASRLLNTVTQMQGLAGCSWIFSGAWSRRSTWPRCRSATRK
jgi:hypothetical protein